MRVHALAGLSSSMRTASHSCIRPFIRLSGSPWTLFVVGRCGRGCALCHSNRALYYVFSSFREGADSKLRNYGWRIREKFDLKKNRGDEGNQRRMVILKFFLNYFNYSNIFLSATFMSLNITYIEFFTSFIIFIIFNILCVICVLFYWIEFIQNLRISFVWRIRNNQLTVLFVLFFPERKCYHILDF